MWLTIFYYTNTKEIAGELSRENMVGRLFKREMLF